MQTLKESGYRGWPYIHNSRDVCFIWYSRSLRTGQSCKDLAWTSFSWTRDTGKLVSENGYLVPVRVPSPHYDKSIEALRNEAMDSPALYRLPSYKEWVGPYLYMEPGAKPVAGQSGLNYALLETEPIQSAGRQLAYGISKSFEPVLCVQA